MRRSRKPVRVFRSDEGSNPSLSVSCQVRAFLPAYLRIARRHWSFRLRLPRDFSTAAPCPSPVGPPRGRDQGAGRKTDASRPHSIATTSKSPPLLEGPYACPPAYLRREDVLGAHFPRPVPSSTPVRAAAGPAATNQSSRAAHSSAPGRPRLSDTGSATVGGMAAALMLATFRLLASTAPPTAPSSAVERSLASNAPSAHRGSEFGRSDVLGADTKRDCSDSPPLEHGHDHDEQAAPRRVEQKPDALGRDRRSIVDAAVRRPRYRASVPRSV
jgi:hypothetical protein